MILRLASITDADLSAVADSVHVNLNHKVSVARWHQALLMPWEIDAPNHGVLRRNGEQIATALGPDLPLPFSGRRTRISADPQVIEGTHAGPELELYRDHAGTAAAHHLVLTRGNDSCYITFREVTRKSLPIFVAIICVGNIELFHQGIVPSTRYLLIHYQVVATLAELRIIEPSPSFMMSVPQLNMHESATLEAA